MGRFFAEFVQPRGATLGLRDYLRMGLIQPLQGLDRNDLAAHDPGLGGAPSRALAASRPGGRGWGATVPRARGAHKEESNERGD